MKKYKCPECFYSNDTSKNIFNHIKSHTKFERAYKINVSQSSIKDKIKNLWRVTKIMVEQLNSEQSESYLGLIEMGFSAGAAKLIDKLTKERLTKEQILEYTRTNNEVHTAVRKNIEANIELLSTQEQTAEQEEEINVSEFEKENATMKQELDEIRARQEQKQKVFDNLRKLKPQETDPIYTQEGPVPYEQQLKHEMSQQKEELLSTSEHTEIKLCNIQINDEDIGAVLSTFSSFPNCKISQINYEMHKNFNITLVAKKRKTYNIIHAIETNRMIADYDIH